MKRLKVTVTYTKELDFSLDESDEDEGGSFEYWMKWVEEQVLSWRMRDDRWQEVVITEVYDGEEESV
jgi:hypothetical protein